MDWKRSYTQFRNTLGSVKSKMNLNTTLKEPKGEVESTSSLLGIQKSAFDWNYIFIICGSWRHFQDRAGIISAQTWKTEHLMVKTVNGSAKDRLRTTLCPVEFISDILQTSKVPKWPTNYLGSSVTALILRTYFEAEFRGSIPAAGSHAAKVQMKLKGNLLYSWGRRKSKVRLQNRFR